MRAQTGGNTRSSTLLPKPRDNIAFGATVYTYATLSCQSLASYGFEHFVIDYALKYVEGRVTTNRIETLGRTCSKKERGRKRLTYFALTTSHPRWRERKADPATKQAG